MMRLTVFIAIINLLIGTAIAHNLPNVRSQLEFHQNKWSKHSLTLETLEFWYRNNPIFYWNAIDKLVVDSDFAEQVHKAKPKSEYQLWTAYFNSFSELGLLSSLMKLSLSLRSYAPVLTSFYQFSAEYETPADCEEWLVLSPKQIKCLSAVNGDIDDAWLTETAELLGIDHLRDSSTKQVLLIATQSVTNANFLVFYKQYCSEYSCAIRYVPGNHIGNVSLSGYGASLTIKSTEYKATNDEDTKNETDRNSDSFGDALLDAAGIRDELAPFTSMDSLSEQDEKNSLPRLDLKVSSVIAQSRNPLKMLRFLTENLPEFAGSIAKLGKVDPELQKECEANNDAVETLLPDLGVFSTRTFVSINGIPLDAALDNPHTIVDILLKEYRVISSLKRFNISTKRAVALIGLSEQPYGNDASSKARAFRVIDAKGSRWWNNLEKDKRYAMMMDDLNLLTQPWFPGRLHPIKKNIYNALFVPNLADRFQLGTLLDCFDWIERGMLIRFGFIPWVPLDFDHVPEQSSSHMSVTLAKLLLVLFDYYGRRQARDFLVLVWRSLGQDGRLTLTKLEAFYNEQTGGNPPKKAPVANSDDDNDDERSGSTNLEPITFAQVLESGGIGSGLIADSAEFLRRIQIGSSGAGFMNGYLFQLSEGYQNEFFQLIGNVLRDVTAAVLRGDVSNSVSSYQYFQSLDNVESKLNMYALGSPQRPVQYRNLESYSTLPKFGKISQEKPISVVVRGDLSSSIGLLAARAAFNSSLECSCFQVALVPSSASDLNKLWSDILILGFSDTVIQRLLEGQSEQNTVSNLKAALELLESPTKQAAVNPQYFEDDALAGGVDFWINGRWISNVNEIDVISPAFVNQLVEYEWDTRLDKLYKHHPLDSEHFVELSALIAADEQSLVNLRSWIRTDSSSAANSENSVRRKLPTFGGNSVSVLKLNSSETDIFFRIVAVIDPIQAYAQKWSGILEVLSNFPHTAVEIRLGPKAKLESDYSSLLKDSRFYRTVFELEPSFDANEQLHSLRAEWNDLPTNLLLTLGMDTPNAWLITPVAANADLDNIKTTFGMSAVSAKYRLRNLLVEGYASDLDTGIPPRGLQYVLTSYANVSHIIADTITMANLGYFQLQAQPGLWNLFIRPGKSSEIYHLEKVFDNKAPESVVRVNNQEYGEGFFILVESWNGVTLRLEARKNQGKELQEILVSDGKAPAANGNGGGTQKKDVWSYVSSWVNGGDKESKDLPTINIFSVASGHLYERFLSIMMLSVRNSTRHPLKFWLIEQFLSPEFKSFVPKLAKAYNFEVVFVTYKWPHWLIPQKEKQRTIWGYKILFLDVLFPLSLDHVIFVDADQIVRADLSELLSTDLQGAPYGYTPFCDSREEMSGFRFWKNGYWKEHLQGRPYHISALYIVDLRRFREIAAGDRLRGQYQTLSRDSNSLSNLDQDLPNNMQAIVPIHSLPQDWLWCETWCSSESLKTAKTIDLCNNPLTKEPKLERAKRLLPEWTTFDNMVQQVKKSNGTVTSSPKSAKTEPTKGSNEEL